MTVHLRAALVLVAAVVFSGAAHATEPTEKEIFTAVKEWYDAMAAQSKRTAKECKEGRGHPIECIGGPVSGNMVIEILSVRKHECEQRRARDEYNCTLSARANVDSTNSLIVNQMTSYLAGGVTYRFRRTGKSSVAMLPWQDE